ncbi:hypothetical protein [Antarcticimicrobium sediminis]|uniref:hypothetical protein n=1 Tax=Antarcticimicrobium sediminis TaxID=2546227 RepID=UPI001404DC35|nr:hypothetical protein [Antarcticimicrobium sediminis]
MGKRFRGRIKDALQSHLVRSGKTLETTPHRFNWLCTQKLLASTLGSNAPFLA